MGSGNSSFFSEDDISPRQQAEEEEVEISEEANLIKKQPPGSTWWIFGGAVGTEAESDEAEQLNQFAAQDVNSATGEVDSVYKWFAYVTLVFIFLGHLASVVIFSLLMVPPKETTHVEDELIAMWYPLLFWPIYTGLLLILFTVFSQMHVSSQAAGTSGRWRFKNPLYVWEAISTVFGLWLFYAAGMVVMIVIGVQLGIYYEPDDEVPLDNDTDKYNFLNFMLWFVSAMCAYISFNFMCVYMSTQACKTVAIDGLANVSIVSFNYNKEKQHRGVLFQ